MRKLKLEGHNFIIRHSANGYAAICDYLVQTRSFQDIAFVAEATSIKPNWALLVELIFDTVRLVWHVAEFRNANIIFTIGYLALPLQLLAKLRIIRCRRLVWFGLFLHSPRAFTLFRRLLQIVSVEQVRYIVFSRSEPELYSRELNIPLSRIYYMPYGAVDNSVELPDSPDSPPEKPYFFAGGASNRDYVTLIRVFSQLDDELIIVCSESKNRDILSIDLPSNVHVITDVSSRQFDDYVRNATACILLIKHNTGAAGQSVLLRYMKYGKAIIASDTDVISEYVVPGTSGILIRNPLTELPDSIRRMATSPGDRERLGEQARTRYRTVFARDAVLRGLQHALFDDYQR